MDSEEKRLQEKLVEDRIIEILKKSEKPLTFIEIKKELEKNNCEIRLKDPERLNGYLSWIIEGLVEENELWKEKGTYDYHTNGNRAKGKVEARVVDGLVQCYVEFEGKEVPIDINNSCDVLYNDEVFYSVNDGTAQVLKVIKRTAIEGVLKSKKKIQDQRGNTLYRNIVIPWRADVYPSKLVARSNQFIKNETSVEVTYISKDGDEYYGEINIQDESQKEPRKSDEEIVHGRNK